MIKSLQGLRALGMLGIFLFHTGLLLKGTFPVTLFFILSGFVLYYSYSGRVTSFKLKENINWVIQRMKKLYPIHLITFVMSIIIRWEWVTKFEYKDIFTMVLINISMLQSLSPVQNFEFNGLSWFLSTTFILYIVAVPLILIIKKYNKIQVKYLVLGILLLQYILIYIEGNGHSELNLYTSPFFRVFDFVIGMLVAKLFIDKRKVQINYAYYSFYEIGICIIFCIMYGLSLVTSINVEYGLSYYSPIFILAIYVMSYEKGFISKMLSANLLQKIAAISFEFYMVHELILIVFRKLFINIQYHWLIKNIIIAIPSFLVSISLAIIINEHITKRIVNTNVEKDNNIVMN